MQEALDAAWEKAGKPEEWGILRDSFFNLKQELMSHILKEETALFPFILHIEECVENGKRPELERHDIRELLEQMECEHNATKEFAANIGRAIKVIGPGEKWSEAFEGLERLIKDLEVHIDKEEASLFPVAWHLYRKATEGMLKEE